LRIIGLLICHFGEEVALIQKVLRDGFSIGWCNLKGAKILAHHCKKRKKKKEKKFIKIFGVIVI